MPIIKAVMKGPNEIFPFDHPVINYTQGQAASNKMDGERMLNLCGEHMVAPSLKPMRNQNLRAFAKDFFDFCKSERLVTDSEIWSPIRKFHMPVKEEGIGSILAGHHRTIPSDMGIYVFDMLTESEWDNETEPVYGERYLRYMQMLQGFPNVHVVEQWMVKSPSKAETFYNGKIENGDEGMILRAWNARYKHGRCTENQDGMWKFKEFLTHDAVIVAIEQGTEMRVGLERTVDAQGKLERSYKQDDYVPSGMVGAFVCRQDGIAGTFKVKPGRGHDNYWKTKVWLDYERYPEKWHGKHLEYKFMPHGTMDKPRIGNLIRMRPDLD